MQTCHTGRWREHTRSHCNTMACPSAACNRVYDVWLNENEGSPWLTIERARKLCISRNVELSEFVTVSRDFKWDEKTFCFLVLKDMLDIFEIIVGYYFNVKTFDTIIFKTLIFKILSCSSKEILNVRTRRSNARITVLRMNMRVSSLKYVKIFEFFEIYELIL